MRTDEQRIARYNARMSATLLDPVRVALVEAQKAHYAAYATEYVPLQMALREQLGEAGVSIIETAAYEAFAGELYHLTKHFSGFQLAAAWADLVTKWSDAAHLGAGATMILNGIALNVFHMSVAPITP